VNTKFLSVLMFQLRVTEMENGKEEYIVENESYFNQMNSSFDKIAALKPDLVVYPEMCYLDLFRERFKKESVGRLIVAGSSYRGGVNQTIVFNNGKVTLVTKRYSSGAEPMARKTEYIEPSVFLRDYLAEHIFEVKGKKVCVLNCMEYYRAAYFLARDKELSKDLFAIVSPCSTSNIEVFEDETKAMHNHNEFLYSFVVNCISTYQTKEYATGESYIYGPIYKHEKHWLAEEGFKASNHPSSIVQMGKTASYLYGEFASDERMSRFGRSDFYESNPRGIVTGELNS